MKTILTQEQKELYLNRRGLSCPVCTSAQIRTYDNENNDNEYYYEYCFCLSCGERWKDIYKLQDVEMEEYPSDEG